MCLLGSCERWDGMTCRSCRLALQSTRKGRDASAGCARAPSPGSGAEVRREGQSWPRKRRAAANVQRVTSKTHRLL